MSELPQVPVRVLSVTTYVHWLCPVCHRAQSTTVTWSELADIIDGGTMEASCEFCFCPVELSGTEVADA